MNYSRHYLKLITKAMNRENVPCEYTERHHIIPRCVGGDDSPYNIISLTAREHYIAHHLLHRMVPEDDRLFFAFYMMAYVSDNNQQRYTSRRYGYLKEEKAERTRKRSLDYWNDPKWGKYRRQEVSQRFKGIKKSLQHKERISQSNKGITRGLGKPKSTEHRNNIGKGQKGRCFSYDTRRKMSNNHADVSGTDNPNSKVTVINGIEFATRAAAGKYFGVSTNTIRNWMSKRNQSNG